MAITIEKSRVIPELKYDEVYLIRLDVSQEIHQEPIIRVEYDFLLFARLPDGTKIFDEASRVEGVIEDFEKFAEEKALGGDLRLVDAISSIEVAVSALIEVSRDVGVVTQTPSYAQ